MSAVFFFWWTAVPSVIYLLCCVRLWRIRNVKAHHQPLSVMLTLFAPMFSSAPTAAILDNHIDAFSLSGVFVVIGFSTIVAIIGVLPLLLYSRHQRKISKSTD